jgi:lycopene cyclase domain-containing protein
LNPHYTYSLILLCALAGPLLLSFDKKVAFYKKWKFLFPSMLLPAFFYIVWDIWFTDMGVWSFNESYILPIRKVFNLPIEEVLFFFIVPYCSVFIYECIKSYFPRLQGSLLVERIVQALAILLFVFAMFFCKRYYTFVTFSLNSIIILLYFIFRQIFRGLDMTAFIVSYLITLIPFLIVNGLLTALPVVRYNDAQNMGVRIYTIPFEDIFYGMLLIFLNVWGYEYLSKKK